MNSTGLNSTNNGHVSPNSDDSPQNARDGPDPDAIKMFVGQIPKSMDEADLKKMFEEYGEVYQVNVLRDKVTGQSKGCCFVTFYARKAALNAQNDLHNIKTLAGMHHPIQMKPADTENRNERKLFVGMLSKKASENDVRTMFSQFGQIEECTVLRDTSNHSKGCAFVTFTTRQSAINAIKSMHHSTTMEGCSSPIVVKFADTQKEKDQKRLHQMAQNIWSVNNLNLAALAPQYLSVLQAMATTQSTGSTSAGPGQATQASSPATNLTMSGLNSLQLQQLAASLAGIHSTNSNQLGLAGLAALQNSATTATTEASNLQGLAALANLSVASQGLNPMSVQNLATLAAMAGGNNAAAVGALLNPAAVVRKASPPVTKKSAFPGMFGGASVGVTNTSALAHQSPIVTTAQMGKQVEGPDGANLFIYHLPQDFSDSDLVQAFAAFGNVISAKVFIDKHTNLSKCFGFVSYDNHLSAQQAIQSMNGFQIGTKRLKVQLKRSKDALKPY